MRFVFDNAKCILYGHFIEATAARQMEKQMTKILGWTDEVTACDCCGKSDLSGTFGVELDDGAIVHYGSVCVKRNTGIKNPTSAAKAYENERAEAARAEYRQSAEFRAYFARQNEGHALRIQPGPAFRDFMAEVSEADRAAQARIAAAHNVPAWRVM